MKYKAVLVLVICLVAVLSVYLLSKEHTASEALEGTVLYCEVWGDVDTSGTVIHGSFHEQLDYHLYVKIRDDNSSSAVVTVSNCSYATLEERHPKKAFSEELDNAGDIRIETDFGRVELTLANATLQYEFETFSCRWDSYEYNMDLRVISLEVEGGIVNLTDEGCEVEYENGLVHVGSMTYETDKGGLYIPRDQRADVHLDAIGGVDFGYMPNVTINGSLMLHDLNLMTVDGEKLRHYDSLSVESEDITLVTHEEPHSWDDADKVRKTPWVMEIRVPGEREVRADDARAVFQVLVMWILVGIAASVLVVRGWVAYPK